MNINTPEFWNDHYGNKINADGWTINAMLEHTMINKIIDELPFNQMICDIACGYGHITNQIQKKGHNCIGVDHSSVIIEKNNKDFPNILFVCSDIFDYLRYNRDFNVIIATEIIEHVDRPMQLIHAISKALRPDGKLIFSIPHKNHDDAYMSVHNHVFDYEKILSLMFTRFNTVKFYNHMCNKMRIYGIAGDLKKN
jgi:2-polyprenyl-3-methyl-5-hydroxy-6-metoxy-1,4-benzoquinol methylase